VIKLFVKLLAYKYNFHFSLGITYAWNYACHFNCVGEALYAGWLHTGYSNRFMETGENIMTKIEWVQNQDGTKGHTWNPTTGCTKISPGCKHCYAETMAKRLQAMGVKGYEKGFELKVHNERLMQPLKRKKATTYFVNSMSDLFHENVPDSFIEQVFEVIRQTPQHTYQILTKRAERMADFCNTQLVPENAWLGVSVEDKNYGLPRIDILRNIDVPIRFLSIEPLLEGLGAIDLSGIHWVIVGGESGPKARQMKLKWVTDIKNQCSQARVPLFIKQMGSYWARNHSKKGKGNDMSEWDKELRVQGYPLIPAVLM